MKLSPSQQKVIDLMDAGWNLYAPNNCRGQWHLSSPVLEATRFGGFREIKGVPTNVFNALVKRGVLTVDGKRKEAAQ